MNKQILIGNLGKDPETINANSTAIVKFSLATTDKYKGEKQTEWHNVIAFGKAAEVLGQYLKKGSKVYVEGKTTHRTYEKKGGTKGYRTEVIVKEFEFLDSKGNNESNNDNNKFAATDEGLPF